jgi:two-component system nitrogen regulation response regulator NtrX
MPETILIVDDEESVRRTFLDWITSSDLGCEAHAVADAEAALLFANKHPIDLAVLDWNLGSGSDGLRLLEDLSEFQPDVVAILVTGFAHQATPLDALRMGVRDYLDKNQDLDRETFLAAVRRQLARVIPAKRQRQFTRGLQEFRAAVVKILPLVQSTAALNDPAPLPDAIRALVQFLMRVTGAADGALVARHVAPDGAEHFLAFGSDGHRLAPPGVPFASTLAATAASMQEVCVMNPADAAGPVALLPFEKGRRSLLAVPIEVGPTTHVVLELFDKAGGSFVEADRRLATAVTDLGAELLRQTMAERQTRRALFETVSAALEVSRAAAEGLSSAPADPEAPPPAAVMDRLRRSLSESGDALIDADTSLRLAEAVRVLARRHGPAAVRHCVAVAEGLRQTLDEITGG